MVEHTIDDYVIRGATDCDLQKILCWLKEEDNGGPGFYGNREEISCAQDQGNLTALVRAEDGAVLGFLLADDQSMSIMEVKPKFQRRGLGRKLAESGLRRIEAADGFGVLIECEPKSSIPFWEALGFRLVDRPGESQNAFLTFPKRFSLPSNAAVASVHVAFSAEGCSNPRPQELFDRRAAWVDRCELALEERIVAFTDSGDAIVRIDIDSRRACDAKVKNSRDAGVQYKRGFVRIDHIICPDRTA